MTHNRNPESVIQLMALDYCELYNQHPFDEDFAEDHPKCYEFDETEYAWQVDPGDLQRSQTDVLLDKILNTLMGLNSEYPHLKLKAFEIIQANIADVGKINKLWRVFDRKDQLIQEIIG